MKVVEDFVFILKATGFGANHQLSASYSHESGGT